MARPFHLTHMQRPAASSSGSTSGSKSRTSEELPDHFQRTKRSGFVIGTLEGSPHEHRVVTFLTIGGGLRFEVHQVRADKTPIHHQDWYIAGYEQDPRQLENSFGPVVDIAYQDIAIDKRLYWEGLWIHGNIQDLVRSFLRGTRVPLISMSDLFIEDDIPHGIDDV